MARIAYSISGEGNGHATRAKAVIDRLSKEHELMIICGGKAYDFLSKRYENVHKAEYLHIKYRKNRVRGFYTLYTNILNIPRHFRSLRYVFRKLDEFRPDIILDDFEYMANYYALLKGVPVITIDNQHMITNTKIKVQMRNVIDYLQSWLTIRLISPKADYRFVTSFFNTRVKRKNTRIIPLILREEVLAREGSRGKHVLVYQTSDTNDMLLDALSGLDHDFIVYGFNQNTKMGNMVLKSFSDVGFLEDFSNSKAVIMNGGFTMMSEALYLKKPILSIPVDKQFEQMLNGDYLQRSGAGMCSARADKKAVMDFLSNLDNFSLRMEEFLWPGMDGFMLELEEKISELVGKGRL